MKQFLFLFTLIIFSLCISAQEIKKRTPGSKPTLITDTAALERLERKTDSLINTVPPVDSQQIRKDAERNINAIVELQNEQQERKRKGAFVRIAIGVGLLVILIIGLARRKRNQVGEKKS